MQQYVLDYTMDGIEPYYLTQINITINNLLINNSSSPPYNIPANTPFHITYRTTNNTGSPQMVYGKLINNATGQPITSPATEWGPILIQNSSYHDSDYFFSSGIPSALNATLNIGHVEYSFSASTNNASWGSVTITNPSPPPSSYYPGQSITLQATPYSGYQFVNWTSGGSVLGTTSPITVSMGIGDSSLVANFAPLAGDTYTIIASAGTGGSITPSGSIVVDEGDSQLFTISASSGYHILSVTVDGAPQGAIGSYTFYNIIANHTISASFESDGGGCTTGETQCINGIWWYCINGVWVQTQNPCCNDTDPAQCINEHYNICQNGAWVPTPAPCCEQGAQKCINGVRNNCVSDTWMPTDFPCQAEIPIEYIIIGGVAVVGGLIAISAATGGLAGYKIGKRRK